MHRHPPPPPHPAPALGLNPGQKWSPIRGSTLRRALLGLLAGLALLAAAPARAGEDIVDVLRRSQETRLRAQVAADADSPRAQVVKQSFERLQQALPDGVVVALQLVQGRTIAETLHGHIVVANEALADMPESVRLFILAHELGHVVLQHWRATALLYQAFIPGEVTPATTDPVAARLSRAASAQSHAHEFAADAFAARLLQTIGAGGSDLREVFLRHGSPFDTASHPGTRRRLAALMAEAAP